MTEYCKFFLNLPFTKVKRTYYNRVSIISQKHFIAAKEGLE